MENAVLELIQNPAGLMLANVGCIILGAVIRAFSKSQSAPMGRIKYWVIFCALTFAISITEIVWLTAVDAIRGGYFTWLFLLIQARLVAYGYLYYWASAGRSLSAYGEPGKAWMGFVPIANLFLLFSPPNYQEQGIGAQKPFQRYIGNPAMILAGLALLALGNGLTKIIERAAENSASMPISNSTTSSLEDILAAEVRTSNLSLPAKVDEVTTLNSITASGKTLSFNYEISDPSITHFNPNFEGVIANNFCSSEQIKLYLERGAELIANYNGRDQKKLASYLIDITDC